MRTHILGYHEEDERKSIVMLCVPTHGSAYLAFFCTSNMNLVMHWIEECENDIDINNLYVACVMFAYKLATRGTQDASDEVGVLKVGVTYFDHMLRKHVREMSESDRCNAIWTLKTYLGGIMPMYERIKVWMEGSRGLLDDLMQEEAYMRLKEHKAKLIQQVWRRVISNPCHVVCQRRLMREWGELAGK